MNTLNLWVRRWGAALVLMAAIFAFSSWPDAPGSMMPHFGGADTLVRKGGHFIGYFLLALAFRRGLAWNRPAGEAGLRTSTGAWVLTALYAATDEFHQSLVPGRGPLGTDVVLDSFAGAAALALFGLWQYRTRRAKQDETAGAPH